MEVWQKYLYALDLKTLYFSISTMVAFFDATDCRCLPHLLQSIAFVSTRVMPHTGWPGFRVAGIDTSVISSASVTPLTCKSYMWNFMRYLYLNCQFMVPSFVKYCTTNLPILASAAYIEMYMEPDNSHITTVGQRFWLAVF